MNLLNKKSALLTIVILLFLFLTGYTQIVTTSFKAYGNCGLCKERIEKSLKIDGVTSVFWDAKTEIVTISYNKTLLNEDQLRQIIAYTGHDTDKLKAKDKAYKALPTCCQYNRNK